MNLVYTISNFMWASLSKRVLPSYALLILLSSLRHSKFFTAPHRPKTVSVVLEKKVLSARIQSRLQQSRLSTGMVFSAAPEAAGSLHQYWNRWSGQKCDEHSYTAF